MDFHVRQVGFKSVSNGYMLQYAQQTNQVTTQEEAVFNTLGQVSAHIDKLDDAHADKVKAANKAMAAQLEVVPSADNVETKNG